MIDEQLWNWAGARWWKFDFHTHTPASTDFGKGLPNDDPQKKPEPKDWLLAFMHAKVDCAAVTDHDTAGWIDTLQDALKEMEREQPEEFRPLTLFPGVEITTSSSAHILAIFPPETDKETLDNFLGTLDLEDYGDTKRSRMNAVEIIEKILEAKALAIPAHLDDNLDEGDGRKSASIVKRHYGFEVERILRDPRVLAVEMKEPTWTGKNYLTELKNRCFVFGSDAHHLSNSGKEFAAYPGSRYTWIKMENPTFEGLKLALIDSRGSVKPYTCSNPNGIAHPVIEKVEVKNAKYLGVRESFECLLNPWMNAIIGGRGTGKSTLLEFLRLGLDRVNEPDSMNPEFKKYYRSGEDESLIGKDTEIMIYFRKDGAQFRLTWRGDTSRLIERMDNDMWVESPGVVFERFPVQIRSQKEIFQMAGNPKQLMELVDESADVKYDEWERGRVELEKAFLDSCAHLRQARNEAGRKESVLGRLQDVGQKIDLYKSSLEEPVIAQYNSCLAEERCIQQWSDGLHGMRENVSGMSEPSVPQLNREVFSLEIDEHTTLLGKADMVEKEISEGIRMIAEGRKRVIDAVNEWESMQSSLYEMERIAAAKSAFAEYKESLGENAGILGASEIYHELVQEREKLLTDLRFVTSAEAEIAELQEKCKLCYAAVVRHRGELTAARRRFVGSKLADIGSISVSVISYGDSASAEAGLRKAVKIEGETFSSSIGTVNPSEDNGSLLGRLYQQRTIQMAELERLKERVTRLWSGGSDGKISEENRFRGRLRKELSVEDLDRFWCWFPDDYLLVRYRSSDEGEGSKFLSLTSGSPGQKSAALLTFILSFGTEPLILDQPEDDLDNRLICQMVVKRLREIKSSRQVIVVTHNANVVINGCAEFVVPLEARDGETRCLCSGCLHEEGVRDEVCSILEGGREAFEKRYRRVVG